MYTCINCAAFVDELYRQYSPSVLKVLKCENCGKLADKYIEYDPVIVLLDLVLLEKSAYRHLLYNSEFTAYWKLLVVLLLGDTFREWTKLTEASGQAPESRLLFEGERNFYFLLAHTALSLGAFVVAILLVTELRWLLLTRRPQRYKPIDLVHALIIGGCAKLLGLLGIIWQHVAPELNHVLIYGYTMLCLLTAYSVVCQSGRTGSFIGLAGGLFAYNYVYNIIPELFLSTTNMTLLQSQGQLASIAKRVSSIFNR